MSPLGGGKKKILLCQKTWIKSGGNCTFSSNLKEQLLKSSIFQYDGFYRTCTSNPILYISHNIINTGGLPPPLPLLRWHLRRFFFPLQCKIIFIFIPPLIKLYVWYFDICVVKFNVENLLVLTHLSALQGLSQNWTKLGKQSTSNLRLKGTLRDRF